MRLERERRRSGGQVEAHALLGVKFGLKVLLRVKELIFCNSGQVEPPPPPSTIAMVPLWQLCWEGRLQEVRVALDSGRNVNSCKGNTSGLMGAVGNFHNSIVSLLLEQPTVDLNGTDVSGETALHFAAKTGNSEGVRLLLGDPRLTTANHKDNKGITPVMVALARNQGDSLRELVAHLSVDIPIKDRDRAWRVWPGRFGEEAERIFCEERQKRGKQAAEAEKKQRTEAEAEKEQEAEGQQQGNGQVRYSCSHYHAFFLLTKSKLNSRSTERRGCSGRWRS